MAECDTATLWERSDMQPGDVNKGKIMNISEESGWNEKDEDVSEEITLAKKKSTLKELLEIFQNTGDSAKDKSLKVQRIKVWKLIQPLKGVWQFTKA